MFNEQELNSLRDGVIDPENTEAQSLEDADGANSELAETVAEALENSEENSLDDTENLDTEDKVIEALGLTGEEAEVFRSIAASEQMEGSSGYAKVYGDCISTTCTYTKTYYSCPSTSD